MWIQHQSSRPPASSSSTEVPRRKVEYGSGLVVNPSGYVLTASNAVSGCHVIAIPGLGNAERLAEDKDSGLALLRIEDVAAAESGATPLLAGQVRIRAISPIWANS